MTTTRKQRGTYAGRSAEERQAARRRQLIDAAIEIWGEHGWAAVTMRGVCARAGLIDRYFYENFTDRDALLAAVWDQLRDETIERLLVAIAEAPSEPIAQLRAAIATFVHSITEDPRLARIGFGEHSGSAVLEQRRRDTVQQFTDLLIEVGTPYLNTDVDPTDLRMSVLLGIGGFTELMSAWLAGSIAVDAERIIDHATTIGSELAARYLAQPESP
ncbi:TetR/AcrR family transcriptional regulator [Haloechinothrix sp. LS1_15]|uniref:TetR/AcrR family transcriptional regulator n=1 Tax=Haloechinothrix sp. LS1_15 TaxID=2652248 RepID=UPI00294B8AB9|nr:TetR/AcrR family transcriptional regulator [Haloechinothrix sp. LS1_15]